jgi:hypothetical protein
MALLYTVCGGWATEGAEYFNGIIYDFVLYCPSGNRAETSDKKFITQRRLILL